MNDEKNILERIENMQEEIGFLKQQNNELSKQCEQLRKELIRVEAGKDVCIEALDKKISRGGIVAFIMATIAILTPFLYVAATNDNKIAVVLLAIVILTLCGAATYHTTMDIFEFFSGILGRKNRKKEK